MTTQYTPILKLALPVTGELSGSWGDVVNDNITSMVEQAIAGLATINTWSTNSHTLTTANGVSSESRCAMLVAETGSGGTAITGAGTIVCPDEPKLYVLQNNTSFTVTLNTAAGTGTAVAAGNTAFLFCDGTDVNPCVTTIVDGKVTGNLTVDGNATINGNTTLGNATTDTITATARFNTDLLPSTDNARDLGSAANAWKDLYIDGTATIATLNVTTIDTTNLEVTNIKAKDGTASITLADTTGIATFSKATIVETTDNTNAALRITQLGTGDALLVEDSTNPDSSPFVIDASGDVGIGTTTPDSYNVLGGAITAIAGSGISNLSIVSGASSTGNILFADGTTGDDRRAGRIAYDHSVNNLYFFTNGNSLKATIDSSGNLGLGVTPSASWWTSTKSIGVGRLGNGVFGATGDDEINIGANVINTGSGTYIYGATDTASLYRQVAAQHVWYYAGSGTAGAALTLSEAMRLDASGRLLIGITSGTSSPFVNKIPNLDVESTGYAAIGARGYGTGSSNAGALVLGRSNSATLGTLTATTTGQYLGIIGFEGVNSSNAAQYAAYIQVAQDGTNGATYVPAYMSFYTGTNAAAPAERMRIDSAGNVGIGSTYGLTRLDVSTAVSAGAVTDAALFTQATQSNPTTGQGVRIYFAASASISRAAAIEAAVSSGLNGHHLAFLTNAAGATPTEKMRISSAGGVSIGDTTDPGAGSLRVTGNTTLGDATTDTVTVNGYMGVGGAGSSQASIYAVSAALTGTAQIGIWSNITATSAATGSVRAFNSAPATAAAVFTTAYVAGYQANNATKGAGSTITDQHGVIVGDLTSGTNNYGITSQVSGGSNKWNIYASGTADNYFAGSVGVGNTVPTTSGATNYRNLVIGSTGVANNGITIQSSTAGNGGLVFNDTNGSIQGSIVYAHNGDYLAFAVNASERMRIDSSGNMGLGVTPSAWGSSYEVFEVRNAGNALWSSAANDMKLTTNVVHNGTNYTYAATAVAARYDQNTGQHIWYNAASGTAGATISWTQAMTLDASGRLLIGATSSRTNNLSSASFLQLEAVNSSATGALVRNSADTSGAGLILGKSRGTSVGSVTAVASGDRLGTLSFSGTDGTSMLSAATIISEVDGTPGTNDMPGRLVFSTTADGASSPTERMRIDSAGNMGLGVTPSAWSSSYRALQFGTTGTLYSSSNAAIANNMYVSSGGTNTYITTAAASVYLQGGGSHQWFNAPSGTAGAAITFTQAMTLDTSGRLLVGLTSSNAAFNGKLQVEGTTDAYSSLVRYSSTASGGPVHYFGRSKSATLGTNTIVASGDTLGSIAFSGANGTGYSDAAYIQAFVDGTPGASADMPGRLVFSTSADGSATPTERMRIDSSGNLLVGTTSPLISSLRRGISVLAPSGVFVAAAFANDGGSSAQTVDVWNKATTGNNSFIAFSTDGGATDRGSISFNRGAGLTAYNTTSDYRAKDILGPIQDSGSVIDSVPVYMGKMKGATQERPMFIAHETPHYAHTGEKDAVDADNNPIFQQMDASSLVPVMWAELQSLRTRMAASEAIITALTARVAALESN